jgi:hypothetical protein
VKQINLTYAETKEIREALGVTVEALQQRFGEAKEESARREIAFALARFASNLGHDVFNVAGKEKLKEMKK